MAGMGVTMAEVRSIKELATTFRWKLEFSKSPNCLPSPPKNFNLLCSSSELPKREANDVIEVRLHGFHIDRPGIQDVSHEFTLTMLETVESEMSDYAYKWMDACWKYNTGVQEDTKDIQGDIILTRLDNKNRPIYKYNILGCYLKDSDPGGEMGSDSEALKPTLVLYYDDFQPSKI